MKKILIVDDEADIIEILQFVLEAQGYECITAMDGEEGLRLAKELLPDLIILDVMMPKINGYKISRLLKYDAKYKNIGEETGVDEYITKPFQVDYVLQKVKSYLE